MKNQNQNLFIIIVITILHNFLFWHEDYGLNVLLFSLALIGSLFFYFPESRYSNSVRITLAGSIITAVFVVIHGSTLVLVTHYISLILLIGFVHQSKLKSITYAFFTAFGSIFKIPVKINSISNKNLVLKGNRLIKLFKLIVFPAIGLILFYFIYSNASSKFDEFSSHFLQSFFEWFAKIFSALSFYRIIIILVTFFIITAIIIKSEVLKFLNIEKNKSENLKRLKTHKRKQVGLKQNLKLEFYVACITVSAINLLLLMANIIDINWVWFNFNPNDVQSLSQFVHEGTYLLIFSILLSMAIMFYFFRANINFYSKNKYLKAICYIWIFQNVILALSVALRNYHYIQEKGFAYKRIGVVFFLALTLFGLITLYRKIKEKKSSYYLVKINTWIFYIMMIITSVIDWDMIIAEYNLGRKGMLVDKIYLLTLDDKTLVLLNDNSKIFIGSSENYLMEYEKIRCDVALKEKTNLFLGSYPLRNWPSWNFMDYKAYIKLSNIENGTK